MYFQWSSVYIYNQNPNWLNLAIQKINNDFDLNTSSNQLNQVIVINHLKLKNVVVVFIIPNASSAQFENQPV